MIAIHRKVQWDLNRRGDVRPIVCVHHRTPGASRRVFVAWREGRQLRLRARRWSLHVSLGRWRRPAARRYGYSEARPGGPQRVEHGYAYLGPLDLHWTRVTPTP